MAHSESYANRFLQSMSLVPLGMVTAIVIAHTSAPSACETVISIGDIL